MGFKQPLQREWLDYAVMLLLQKDPDCKQKLFDFVKQVSFYIVGNDLTGSRTIEAGVMNENPYIPIILASLFESINLVRRTVRTIKERVFEIMEIK